MGQVHTKKESNKVLTCQDLINVFYGDKNSLIEQKYVYIISQSSLNPYQIEILTRIKQELIDQWNLLFKKKQKLLTAFPMNQLLNQFVPSTILNLNEEQLNQYYSLFLLYLSDETIPITEENLIKIASSIYKNNQTQTKKQLDSLQNQEEITYLKNLRQQIPQQPIFKNHWSKIIRIVNLLKLILENNCQLIYAFINTIKDNSAQIYFYSFFWEQYVQTMVPLRVFSQCLHDFSNVLDTKYGFDLPKLRIESMGAKIWSQTFQPWIQMNVNLLEKQIFTLRDNQLSVENLPNFIKSLFDLMYSEKTLKWIGHSQVQHNSNIMAFKILLTENTKLIQQKWTSIELENVPQKILDDISIMKKILPSWLLNLTVTTIHLQYLKSRLSTQLVLLPQETINSIMNTKLKQLQKQFDLIQDQSDNYMVVRQSKFDVYEILSDLSYFKNYIEKSEFSTAKTQGSNFQFSKFQSVLSSGLSDQCISFQQQQQQQKQQQQQQDNRKYSNESFTEEIQSNDQNLKQEKNSQQVLSEVIEFYLKLMIETQIDIQDRNKRVTQKNQESEIPKNQVQIQFMEFFPQFRSDSYPQMNLYKEYPQDQNCLSENIKKSAQNMQQ